MILKPQFTDIKIIGYYLGKMIIGLGCVMLVCFLTGLFIFKEYNPALDFLISAEITLILGLLLNKFCATDIELSWMHSMVIVSLSWLAAMFLAAIPLYLSGHFLSFLDTCFETMSGFTTTGLSLVQDLDHLSYTHNLWRHLGPFLGGQGMAIVALAVFVKGASGVFRIYVGEAREEKILPNVINTSRAIWLISIVFLVVGTLALGITGMAIGLRPKPAFFHGLCIFMAGFDTAGFAPQSQNILYYHSGLFECVTMVVMIMGALNFNLHYQLWRGNFKEIVKNIETRTFLLCVMLIFFVTASGLIQGGIYPKAIVLFRKGFFHLISGHTTTGYMTVYARQFISDWGPLALVGLICAMVLGGCSCSTAGGIKMLRAGIIYKAMREDLKRIMFSADTVITQRFHHIKTFFLEDKQVKAVLLITMAYIILYFLGALIGVWLGFPALESLFESVSAAGNVGLSCGITSVDMPVLLKMTYIIQMWAGRLEFMSVFALLGFMTAFIRGK